MSIYKTVLLPRGIRAAIVVRQKTLDRLATTCFRGSRVRLAGNFNCWSSATELLHDGLIYLHLLKDLNELDANNEFATHSLMIAHPTPVGWASTAPAKNYRAEDLERFTPNRRSSALRVKLDRTDLHAPKTNYLTFVYEFKREDDLPVAVVHSIYPGEDVGEIAGDITAREGVVFFDWNHPGDGI